MIQKLQKKKNQKMNRNNLRPQRTINLVSNAISQDILQRTVQVRSPVITVVKLVILQKIVQIIQTWKQISYATTVMKLVTVKETVLKIAEALKRILIWNATIVKKPATYQGIVQKMVVLLVIIAAHMVIYQGIALQAQIDYAIIARNQGI